LSWQVGTGEEVQRHLLPGGIPKEHRTGERSAGKVHEGQTPEYGGARLRDPNPVHGVKEDKYLGIVTGQQGNAAIGHCLQHQKIPEILGKTHKKWIGKHCSAQLHEKGTPQVYLLPFWHYKNEWQHVRLKNKTALKGRL